jgi:glutathione S-transferase
MTDEIVFYTNPMSRGRIVRWMLEELGQPYETKLLDYGTTMKSPEYLAINPMGKVPAITHASLVVTEAAAICAYLADAFPQAKLAPPTGSKLRGDYYRWMFYAAGPVESAVTNTALKVEVPPDRSRMPGYGSMAHVMDTLESLCENREFLVGDTFTAVDVYLGSQIGWGILFGSMEKRPAFTAYVARTSQRPAAIRAREIDDALIAK